MNGVVINGTLADPTLHPEREKEIEGGVDFALLQLACRLLAHRLSEEQLRSAPPAVAGTVHGIHVRIFNGGEIRNRGIEALLSGVPSSRS